MSDFATLAGRARRRAPGRGRCPRLTYANAAIAEALIAAGEALGDKAVLADGLALLGWLLDVETSAGHLSVTAGRRMGAERTPGHL